jgi:AraC-like DNA-binding protein
MIAKPQDVDSYQGRPDQKMCMNYCLNETATIDIRDLSDFVQDHFPSGSSAARFDAFLLIHIIHGKGKCWMDVKECSLLNDSILCIYPGQLIAFGPETTARGTVVLFSSEFLCFSKDEVWRLLHADLFSIHGANSFTLPEKGKAEVRQLLQAMTREQAGREKLNREVLCCLLRILVITLGRKTTAEPFEGQRRRDTDQVTRFCQLVGEHFFTLKKVSDYSRMMGMTSSYLNVVVKRVSGYSAKRYIQQQIILEAKRQIRWDGKSLKEIAYSLGYLDTAHFSRFFKNIAGISYSDFKRSQMLR